MQREEEKRAKYHAQEVTGEVGAVQHPNNVNAAEAERVRSGMVEKRVTTIKEEESKHQVQQESVP